MAVANNIIYFECRGVQYVLDVSSQLPKLNNKFLRSNENIKDAILLLLEWLEYRPVVFLRPLPVMLRNYRDVSRINLIHLLSKMVIQINTFLEVHNNDISAVKTVCQSLFIGNSGFCYDLVKPLDTSVVSCTFKVNGTSYHSYIPLRNVASVVSNFFEKCNSLSQREVLIK